VQLCLGNSDAAQDIEITTSSESDDFTISALVIVSCNV
jgi:hypothetical protein